MVNNRRTDIPVIILMVLIIVSLKILLLIFIRAQKSFEKSTLNQNKVSLLDKIIPKKIRF